MQTYLASTITLAIPLWYVSLDKLISQCHQMFPIYSTEIIFYWYDQGDYIYNYLTATTMMFTLNPYTHTLPLYTALKLLTHIIISHNGKLLNQLINQHKAHPQTLHYSTLQSLYPNANTSHTHSFIPFSYNLASNN